MNTSITDSSSRRKIIAVDFDGTLCESDFPNIGKPKRNVIDWVLAEQSAGAILILWTCRTGISLDQALMWCRRIGIEFDYVNHNCPNPIYPEESRKIYADVYLDDHALNESQIDNTY